MTSSATATQPDDVVGAIVVGGGMAGLNAARELTRAGIVPLLFEARGRTGGLVFGGDLGEVRVDLGAESFAKRSRYVASLCGELGLPTMDPSGHSWIWSQSKGGIAYRIPHGVLGIPTSLDDPDVTGVLSPAGLARAREDLALPPGVGADCVDLKSLVTARIGREAYEAFVEPVAGGIHSADPATLSTEVVTPGLRRALVEQGSLVRAAAALRADAPPGAVVSSIPGGLFRLADALADDLAARGGECWTRMVVTRIERSGDAWDVTVDNASPSAAPHLVGPPLGQPALIRTPLLIVALDGRAALDLLRPIPELGIGDWTLPRGADLLGVALALDCPALDGGPRGSGLLVAQPAPGEPPLVGCKALTHYSIKWPWVLEHQHNHVVRVSYGRAGVPTIEPPLAATLQDASTLLGVRLEASMVRGQHVVRFENSLAPQTPDHRARVAALASAVAGLPGLGVTGAWVAGNGLAAVLPHAARVAAGLSGATVEP